MVNLNTLSLKQWAFTFFVFYITIKITFIFSGHDLFTEEAQYWLWSRYLDWSYYSKPPLIAWVNFIVTEIFGRHDYVIRLTALTFGLTTLMVVWHVALTMFRNERIAVWSTIILSISPHFILASTFLTTDTLLLFFWASTFLFFIKALEYNNLLFWSLAGIAFGLGCLSKYSMVFFIFVLVGLILLKDRKVYFKGIAIMLTITCFMNLPILVWNYQHDWVSVKHVAGLGGIGRATFDWITSMRNIGEFLGGVLLINSPFFVPYLVNVFHGIQFRFPTADRAKMTLLVAPAIGAFIVLLFISILKRVEVNWASMTYLLLPLCIAYWIELKGLYKQLSYSIGLTSIIVLLLLFPSIQDTTGLSLVIPIKMDSMTRMAGWKDLSDVIVSLRKESSLENSSFVFSDSYQIASELAFYTGDEKIICVNTGRRMNQFDIWNKLNANALPGHSGIFVTDGELRAEIRNAFDGNVTCFVHPVMYRGQKVREFEIYVLHNFTFFEDKSILSY